jgi:tetratricopeptide (TPR) repeat protein
MRALVIALILSLGIAAAGESALKVDQLRAGEAPGQHLLYLPSGKYLRVATLGYSALAADLIYIWSIQYYSSYQASDRYSYLDQIYRRVIGELDPHYIDPFLIGSMIMSVEAGRNDLALGLLDDGIAKNPGEWILPFSAGFLCYNTLHDYARARSYFEKVISIPGAPPAARRFYAEMFSRMGDKRTSLRYWSEIHDTADSGYVRNVSWLHVHDLSIEVALQDLASGVESYRATQGRLPERLQDLVRSGILPALPSDPEGRPYRYDPSTGKVICQARRLLQGR